MAKSKKMKKSKKRTPNKDWSAMDEVRHQTPRPGFAFKDRKEALKTRQDHDDMKNH